jgi:glycine cleavage system H protein
MEGTGSKYLHYKRSHFATLLPFDYLYSPTHYWLSRQPNEVWRVGFTKFAVRMLGDMVDHGFELNSEAKISPGMVLGWFEGFKAMADVYCLGTGVFLHPNPELKTKLSIVNKDPYARGWLYEFRGQPDSLCIGAEAYRNFLDKTIDRMLEKQGQADSPEGENHE